MRRRAVMVLVAAVLLGAGCGESDELRAGTDAPSTSATASTTTTVATTTTTTIVATTAPTSPPTTRAPGWCEVEAGMGPKDESNNETVWVRVRSDLPNAIFDLDVFFPPDAAGGLYSPGTDGEGSWSGSTTIGGPREAGPIRAVVRFQVVDTQPLPVTCETSFSP